ncbi:MAG: MogA/MoaB family molybdenum cofactor biosynthesis protein [Planctomycetota bacterium]|jgi:molybdenum cofactor biosynthesis protein B
MPTAEHRGRTIDCVTCAIVTVSDTRTPDTDASGALIRDRLESAGHRVASYEIIPDDAGRIRDRLVALCDDPATRAVLLTGGTGLAQRDTTCEVLGTVCEKRLDGFGELFRMLSYDGVGSAAMLSRAAAGVSRATVIFSMPGSTGAVTLAMDKLILPEIGHIAAILSD